MKPQALIFQWSAQADTFTPLSTLNVPLSSVFSSFFRRSIYILFTNWRGNYFTINSVIHYKEEMIMANPINMDKAKEALPKERPFCFRI